MARLSAFHENREYFFELKSKDAERIAININSTEYAFVREGSNCVNANSNANSMVPGLISGVMTALKISN